MKRSKFSPTQIAKILNWFDVRPALIYCRHSQFAIYQGKIFPENGNPKMTAEESELARVKVFHW